MSKIDLSSSLPKDASAYYKLLDGLCASKRPLIVNKQGSLSPGARLEFALEKLKDTFYLSSRANQHLIQSKTLELLKQGKGWISSQEDLNKVMLLAQRTGLAAPGQKTSPEFETFLANLSNPSQGSGLSSHLPLKLTQSHDGLSKEILQKQKANFLLKTGAIAGGILTACAGGSALWPRSHVPNQGPAKDLGFNQGLETNFPSNIGNSQEVFQEPVVSHDEQFSLHPPMVLPEIEIKPTLNISLEDATENFENIDRTEKTDKPFPSPNVVQLVKENPITTLALAVIVSLAAYLLLRKKSPSNEEYVTTTPFSKDIKNNNFKNDTIDLNHQDSLSEVKKNLNEEEGFKTPVKVSKKEDQLLNPWIQSPRKGILRLQNEQFYETHFKELNKESYERIIRFLNDLKNPIEGEKNHSGTDLKKSKRKLNYYSPQKENSYSEKNEFVILSETMKCFNNESPLEKIKDEFQRFIKENNINSACTLVEHACKISSDVAKKFVEFAIDHFYENRDTLSSSLIRDIVIERIKFSTKETPEIPKQTLEKLISFQEKDSKNPYLYDFLMACIQNEDNENFASLIEEVINSDKEVCRDALYQVFKELEREDIKNLQTPNCNAMCFAFILASKCAGKTSVACQSINEKAFTDLLSTKEPRLINFALQLAGMYCPYFDETSKKVLNTIYEICRGDSKEYKDLNLLDNHLDFLQSFFYESAKNKSKDWKTVIDQAINSFEKCTKPNHFMFALKYLSILNSCDDKKEPVIKEVFQKGMKLLEEKKDEPNFKNAKSLLSKSDEGLKNFLSEFFEEKNDVIENKDIIKNIEDSINQRKQQPTNNTTEEEKPKEEEKKKCILF